MSLWIEENEDEYNDGTYYSIKALQKEAKLFRNNYKLEKEPTISDMTICFFCKKEFIYPDTINFYSDTDNEYCYHQKCSYTVYKYEKNKLVVADLQNIINETFDIDYSHDSTIPSNIYKLNLIQKYRDYNLDFSESNIQELIVSDYDKLESENFKSVIKLESYRTLVDFTKFIKLNKLKLERPLINMILTPCQDLMDVQLKNIDKTIDFTDCINLKKLTLTNISASVIVKGCNNLKTLELNNVKTLISVKDCLKLDLLRLENMININIPNNINSLTNLHINNMIDSIDVSSYPNLKNLTTMISHNDNNILNYEKLEHLEVFYFTDVRYIDNKGMIYNFDFTKNNKLKTINIYSAINKCNLILDNINLIECILEFNSDNPINIPKNVKKLKYKTCLNVITNK